jgi:hypothetical protein
MTQKAIYIAFLFFTTGLNVVGQNTMATNEHCSTKPPDFTRLPSYKEMNVALDAVLRLHPVLTPAYASNLVYQIREDNVSTEAKVYAIFLLGELRSTNIFAIEALVDRIDLKAPRSEPALRLRLWGEYPAVEALEKIGLSAVNPILNRLPNEGIAFRRHLMCKVLIFIEGKKGGNVNQAEGRKVVLKQVQDKLGNESDPAKRVNLELVLKEVQR